MRKRKNKLRSEKKHFATRSLQRVGVVLNQKELIKKIQKQELPFLYRQSNRVSLFKYTFNGSDYKIVYDKERKQVVTIIEIAK